MASNDINLFIIGIDSHIYHRKLNSQPRWQSTGDETFIYDPVAISCATDRVDVFAIGTDSALYHKWLDGKKWGPSQNEWENFGHVWREKPVVVSRGPNLLDVFVVGTDRLVYWKSWNGKSWSDFKPVDPSGGNAFRGLHTPTVVSYNTERMDLLYVGLDSKVYHSYWPSGDPYREWCPFSAIRSDSPIVSSVTGTLWETQIHVFSRDYYSRLYHQWFDFANSGAGWQYEIFDQEKYRGTPEAISRKSGSKALDVFVTGMLFHTCSGPFDRQLFMVVFKGMTGLWSVIILIRNGSTRQCQGVSSSVTLCQSPDRVIFISSLWGQMMSQNTRFGRLVLFGKHMLHCRIAAIPQLLLRKGSNVGIAFEINTKAGAESVYNFHLICWISGYVEATVTKAVVHFSIFCSYLRLLTHSCYCQFLLQLYLGSG